MHLVTQQNAILKFNEGSKNYSGSPGDSVSKHDVGNLGELSISHGGDIDESVYAKIACLSPLRSMDGDARCESHVSIIPGYGIEAHDVVSTKSPNLKTLNNFGFVCNPLISWLLCAYLFDTDASFRQ